MFIGYNVDDDENRESPDNFYASCNGFNYCVGSEDHGYLGTFPHSDAVLNAVRDWAEQNNWYPELYFVSDHGNIDENPTSYMLV